MMTGNMDEYETHLNEGRYKGADLKVQISVQAH